MNTPPATRTEPRIELLGVPRLVRADGSAQVLERHDAALLAWLALHGPTPRSRLVGLLWPDVPSATARTNLRQRLFRLKQRAGTEFVVSGATLCLAAGIAHDLEAAAAPNLQGAAATRPPTLLGTLDYDDCSELAEWVAAARERWALAWRNHLAQHAARLEAEGRIAEALAFAERLTQEAPSAEHAHRRVMRLHYRRGDRAAALAAFERCRRLLDQELGTRPGAETSALAALIERSGALPPPQAVPSPVATLRPPRLVGREPQWRAIEAAWRRHQPVLVLGEPGIGKSRLAADFAASQVQSNVQRAHAGDASVPYSLLARLLRGLIERFGALPPGAEQAWIGAELAHLLPELEPRSSAKLAPLRLRQAVAAALRHWQTRGLAALVIDDLHFADPASLELVLAWLGEAARVQVVMTVRSNELPQVLREWLDAPDVNAVCEVALGPLDVAAIATLLDTLAIPGLVGANWAEPLARHSGGNPLFILETLKSELSNHAGTWRGLSPAGLAPAGIGRLLAQRLAQLPPDALRLARVAALAGPDFSAGLAARVLDVHVLDLAEPWAELERAQIISDGAFAHDLILEATRRSVPDAIAQTLHGSIAQALETDGQPAARVAHHWHGARDWARAAPHFERAAEAALAASRPAESLALWDRAAQCHQQSGARAAEFRARCAAIDPAIVVGPAAPVRARVEALVADSRDDAERLAALIAQAQFVATGGDFASALPITTQALALARGLGDRRSEFMAVNLHGVALTMTGQAAAGLALFDAMAAVVGEAGDAGIESEFCSAFGNALHASGRWSGESVLWCERAAELSQRCGDTNNLAINLSNLAVALAHTGQHERALEAAQRAHAVRARLGELQGEAHVIGLLNLGAFYRLAGRFGEALDVYQRALDAVRAGTVTSLAALTETNIASTYLMIGQPARAHHVLSPLPPDASVMGRVRRAIVDWCIASFTTRAGPQRLLQALDDLGPHGQVMDRLGLELAIAAALPADESLVWSQRMRDEALAGARPTIALTALIRLADAQRRLGQWQAAAASARTAVAEAAHCGLHDLPLSEFWWIAFEALDGAGCEAEALQALRAGAQWATRAAAHVPEVFRDSYLNRSPFVPQLLAAARRRLER